MKMFSIFLAISFLVPFVLGCASCPCEKKSETTPVAHTAPVVAAPVVTPTAPKPAPAVTTVPEKKIPAAVMK